MKKYNAKLIRDFVEANKIGIKTVHLGMKEDWHWTNDLLYDADKGGYQFDLGKLHIKVRGITGSSWATPVMLVRFVDGMKLVAPCYYEDGRKFSSADIAMRMYVAKMTGGMDDVLEGLTDEQ